jgi:hypothetical protein
MAAAAALNVVKQIEALADAPETPQMKDSLGQLVTSLQFFLDHPDSRVRLGAARTLLKLSRGYSEDFKKIDLVKATSALARCRACSEEADEETAELGRLLAETLEGEARTDRQNSPGAAASSADDKRPKERGEVVLKVPESTEQAIKVAIQEKVIKISGVVSAAFEAENLIVNTLNLETSRDPALLKELLGALTSQGLEGISAPSRPAVPGIDHQSPDDGAEPGYIDDEDGEPAYLDDDDDDNDGVDRGNDDSRQQSGGKESNTGDAGSQNWSFFAQTNWMTGRRMQEFDDDPTIAARLAKAKQKREEKKKEDDSRIGFLTRWLKR